MQPRGPFAAFLVIAFVLLVGLLAGCGGGDGSQGGEAGGAKREGGGGQGAGGQKAGASESKTALGTVVFINPETERFTLRPAVEAQGKKPIPFKVTPKAKITLDDKEATFEDMEQGQQAQVTYVVRNDQNRVRTVTLFSKGESGG